MIEYRQLNEAIENQDLQQVVYWLEQCNPEIINPWTVAMAVGPTQNFEILKVLAQVTDMHREESCALRQAAEYNNLEAVQLLLPLSDAKACQSEALFWACIIENQEMFDVLYPHSNPNDALKLMKNGGHESKKYPGEYEGERMIRERLAQEERDYIQTRITENGTADKRTTSRSKI